MESVDCDLLKVRFKKNYLEKCYRNKKDAIKRWGLDVGTKYVKQLSLIYASQTIEDLYLIPQLGFHPLRENRKGEYAVKLTGRVRLILTVEKNITIIVKEVNTEHYE